jgi:hypothetical protein
MKTKITLSFARLLRLTLNSDINAAEFSSSSKKLLAQFLEDNVLDYRLIGKQQRKVFCPDVENLSQYLHNKFEIPSLDGYIDFLEKEDIQRSDAVRAVADTKFRKTKVFTGFMVNGYEEIMGELHQQPFLIKPVAGTFTFISAYQHFRIPTDITVIIVEGHENFREIARQKYLFEGLRPLFVWRYQNSTAIANWLKSVPNPYLHFGDFDPKGIHIYLTEFKNKIQDDRGQYLIPDDIESLLIQHGEKELYEKQKRYIPLISTANQPQLSPLIDIMLKHKKGLAQEILIR